MPAINGFGLLRSAREAGSDAAFIVMTGDSIDRMLVEGLRFRVFGIIDKPINRLALIALIQQAIESHRLRQEVTELRRTLIEAGTELGNLVRGIVPETEEAFQPPLPY
jgi:FixJ family two-component response regulator